MRGTDQRAVLGIGALAGLGLALRGLSPTGSAVIDVVLLMLVAAGAVWAAASAPWWALSGVAAVAAAIAPPVGPLLIGVGVFGLSLAVGAIRRSQPIERAAVAGAAMLVLSMARELRWFGTNSAIAIVLVATVAGLGVWRRSSRERRLAGYALGAAATIAAIGVLGILAAGSSAQPDLREGNRTANQGLRLLTSGEFDLAQEAFERAAAAFARADDDLGAPWAQASRLVPIASQHRNAGAALSGAAAAATETIQRQLRAVDLDSLRIVDGRIDVDAVRSLQAPMRELQSALGELEGAVDDARSDWLVSPIQDELDELQLEIDEQQELGDKAVAALEVAPAILGANGERVYLVMFTTPAEARGQGGFMGNYAELTVDDGRITMSNFGRHTDLNEAGDRPRRLVEAPTDWLARYSQFGFRKGPDLVVGEVPWSNITISANFPSTAQVAAELYPQSGGRPIDGVISLDVFATEALVGLIGPLEVEGAAQPLTGATTADFLLLEQYTSVGSKEERVDLLETVARETFDALLTTNPPDPIDLGRALAPMVDQRRLMGWARDAAEQAVISTAGMDGTVLSGLDGADGVAVTVVNASGNKIDTFLRRSYEYRTAAEHDELRLRLTNGAPSEGYPDYVIGNSVGLPDGWSRLWLTVYLTRTVSSASIDGAELRLDPGFEAGLNAYSAFIDIGPGETADIALQLEPAGQPIGDRVTFEPSPLASEERWTVEVAGRTESDVPQLVPWSLDRTTE